MVYGATMNKKQKMTDKEALRVVIRYCVGTRVQKEVAERGGLDATTMSQFASGKRFPRPENMEKLAKALGSSPSTIKAAVAEVLAVDERGGGEDDWTQAISRVFLKAESDNVATKIERIQSSRLQDIFKNMVKCLSDLADFLANGPHRQTE